MMETLAKLEGGKVVQKEQQRILRATVLYTSHMTLRLKDIAIINSSIHEFIEYTRQIAMKKRNKNGIELDENIMLKREFPIMFDRGCDLQTKLFAERQPPNNAYLK